MNQDEWAYLNDRLIEIERKIDEFESSENFFSWDENYQGWLAEREYIEQEMEYN